MRLSLPPTCRGAAAVAATLVAACVSSPIGAQQLRGVVRDSAARQPIPAVVLIIQDSAGAPILRSLTNERGEFRMPLAAGARRLQLLRIGFRPRELTLPLPVNGVIALDVSMRMIPTLLEPVRVLEQPNCPRRDDRAAALALWDQARSALLAAVVARETETAVIKRLHFDRKMGQDGFTPLSQIVNVDSSAGARPFVATHDAAEFVERGFVDDSANVAVFNGPDADVMLDDAFPQGYCFSLADPEPERAHQIGLGFEAASHKRGRVDVEGAVWIDSTTRSLVEIVFRYAGLDRRFDRYEPGGHVSFKTMADGTPIIDRWLIRPIGVPERRTDARQGMGFVTMSTSDFHENGGEVARARWDDGKTWAAPLGTLSGVVTLERVPAPGRVVTLAGTDYIAVSDSLGRFTIPDLVPGPYSVAVADTLLASLDIVLKTRVAFVAARDSTVSVTFEAPTADEYAAQMCPRTPPAAGRAVVLGRALLPDGSPVASAEVDAALMSDAGLVHLAKGKTDGRGLFNICNIPVGAKVQVHIERELRTGLVSVTDTYDVIHNVEAWRLTLQSVSR